MLEFAEMQGIIIIIIAVVAIIIGVENIKRIIIVAIIIIIMDMRGKRAVGNVLADWRLWVIPWRTAQSLRPMQLIILFRRLCKKCEKDKGVVTQIIIIMRTPRIQQRLLMGKMPQE